MQQDKNDISSNDKPILDVFFELKGQEKYKEALDVLLPLKEKYIKNHVVLFLIGSTQYLLEDFEQAEINLREALKVKPEYMLASLTLVHVLSELKKWHSAFQEIRRFLSTNAQSRGEHKALIREMLEGLDDFSTSEKTAIKKLGHDYLRK